MTTVENKPTVLTTVDSLPFSTPPDISPDPPNPPDLLFLSPSPCSSPPLSPLPAFAPSPRDLFLGDLTAPLILASPLITASLTIPAPPPALLVTPAVSTVDPGPPLGHNMVPSNASSPIPAPSPAALQSHVESSVELGLEPGQKSAPTMRSPELTGILPAVDPQIEQRPPSSMTTVHDASIPPKPSNWASTVKSGLKVSKSDIPKSDHRNSFPDPISELFSNSNWPSLAATNSFNSKKLPSVPANTNHVSSNVPLDKPKTRSCKAAVCPPVPSTNNISNDLRFPWAAKMDPLTRNLFQATAPTYLEDSTPKVKIPSQVFLHGLENQKEYVIGQFYHCSSPSGGLIHAVLNRIWGRNCKIFTRRLSDSSYLFHIPDESTRKWVIQRSLWHVDECLIFVAPWTPSSSLELPVISTVPVWVTLKDIPSQLYSIPGISWIASGLGAPMATNKPRLDPSLMGEAKVLVEVELQKQFPRKIALEDNDGKISMVQVEYSWIPSTCGRCGHLGHKERRCLQECPKEQLSDSMLGGTSSTTQAATVTVAPISESAPPFKNFTFRAVDARVKESVSLAKGQVPPLVTNNVSVPAIEEVASPKATSANLSTFVSQTSDVSDSTRALASNTILPQPPSIKDASATQEILPSQLNNTEVDALHGDPSPFTAVTGKAVLRNKTSSDKKEVTGDRGNNLFAVLDSNEEESHSDDSSENEYSLLVEDQMTATGKRLLRDRPVKPSQKVEEMRFTTSAGHGYRGRGRGGRKGRGGRG